jgi:Tol biopolymer transport system component
MRRFEAAAIVALALAGPVAAAPAIRLIGLADADSSLGPQSEDAPYLSPARTISSDGRYALFIDPAGNLVGGDTNDVEDVFRRDLTAGATLRASVATGGAQADGGAGDAAMSADGRFVVFVSRARNLAAGTSGVYDVYLRDTQAQTTELVSVNLAGTGGAGDDCLTPSVSDDGRFVAWTSAATNLVAGDTNDTYDVFVRDRTIGVTSRANLADTSSAQADGFSFGPEISANGRFVVFRSDATNLVAGDTNGWSDIFVRDMQLGTTVRASVGAAGAQSNDASYYAAISGDGRYVAFESTASNLVAGDANPGDDVFVRDLMLGTTALASVSGAGVQGDDQAYLPVISADGRYVGFVSAATNLVANDTNGVADAFVHDRVGGGTVRASVSSAGAEGDRATFGLALSANGRYVAFQSAARNLVAGDTNFRDDVFVRDTVAGTTVRASLADASGPFAARPNASSADVCVSEGGRVATFVSSASDLVAGDGDDVADLFVRDTATGAIAAATAPADAASYAPSISRDGSAIAFASDSSTLVAGDANGVADVFVRDATGTTRASTAAGGGDADGESYGPAISADGRWIAFVSTATDLLATPIAGTPAGQADVYVRDRVTGTTLRASVTPSGGAGDGDSYAPSLSEDGRYVVFTTNARNLVAGDASARSKIVRRDVVQGTSVLVSVAATNPPANGSSDTGPGAVSASGRFVTFASSASNIVAGDANGQRDVFVRDIDAGVTTRASLLTGGVEVEANSNGPSISADGRFVAFDSAAPSLAGDPGNGVAHVYLHDRRTGATSRVSTDASATLGDGESSRAIVSHDGRNVAFESTSRNWSLDAGGQGRYADVYLVQLIEPTTTALALAPEPSVSGQPVTATVTVGGSDTNPRGGAITVSASSGESCSVGVLVETAATTSSASCTLTFASAGSRTVSAAYAGSPNYLSSGSPATTHAVVANGIFSDGFE